MRVAALVILVSLAGCLSDDPLPEPDAEAPDVPVVAPSDVHLQLVADGFDQPTFALGTDAGIFVLERPGRVIHVEGEKELALDLTEAVLSGGQEQGLLGMAVHGDLVVLAYTETSGATALYRYALDGARIQATSAQFILSVAQPFANHNGGMVAFGPDGHLYVGLGDGGLAGDPNLNGQNPFTLLGSLLRIDLDGAPYSIPADNPYADGTLGAPEVWATGLRNPWRYSFDQATGDLWIGDVGQDAVEEIDYLAAGHPGGANFGWNPTEGTFLYPAGIELAMLDGLYELPVTQYEHDEGCSITGGYVVRDGSGLEGQYVFGDYCTGTIWTLAGPTAERQVLLETELNISSFGQGPGGEVYVVDLGGGLYRLHAP